MKTPPQPAPTPAQLRRMAREWQRRLRLQDWQVEIAFDRSDEFFAQGCEGLCRMVTPRKMAFISILHPDDYAERETLDVEATVVHELLHLFMVGFCADQNTEEDGLSHAEMAMEQATDAIAQALVAAHRANHPGH